MTVAGCPPRCSAHRMMVSRSVVVSAVKRPGGLFVRRRATATLCVRRRAEGLTVRRADGLTARRAALGFTVRLRRAGLVPLRLVTDLLVLFSINILWLVA